MSTSEAQVVSGDETRIAYRVCPFCEATCGLALEIRGRDIVAVRGDRDDVFSHGFICPKAQGVKEMYHDPDRLERPVLRTSTGWREISWEEAFSHIATRLGALRDAHGADSVGVFAGNPIVVHDLAFLYLPVLAQALGTKNMFNPASIDTLPKDIQTGLMYGGWLPVLSVAVPDIDRTDYLLVIGANPAVSHGSLMTMPNAPGRLTAVRKRGGRLVVIDPRRSETAKLANEHHFLRPGSDAALLLAMVHTLFEEQLVSLGAAEGRVNGLEAVAEAVAPFTPEAVATFCRMPAQTIRRLAREFASAKSAVCYGRLGTCVQPFGTLASWGVDLLNILSGNLDRPGGAMFPDPAAPYRALGAAPPFSFGRWASRVSQRPETGGMLPASTMAEEILTPGEGQIRAMLLLMTNPLRSAANSATLERAFRELDFLVAVDCYINETTRLAHLILPTPPAAQQGHFEFGPAHLAVRNTLRWSGAPVPPPPDAPSAWQVLLRIAAPFMGLGDADDKTIDDAVFTQVAAMAATAEPSLALTAEEIRAALATAVGPERIIDMLLRLGPRGDAFGRRAPGMTLDDVKAAPHGIDLGPLTPRLAEVLNTASGRIELAPSLMLEDLPRLRARMAEDTEDLLLIGRRVLRSSNSFMHNLPFTARGEWPCTLQMSPEDADRLGVHDGGEARITSRTGSVVAPVQVTPDLMPGVVSLPHGYGHDAEEMRLGFATRRPGVNANALTDDQAYDEPSGTAVLFGTPVTVEPA